jgi:hypothetical protein
MTIESRAAIERIEAKISGSHHPKKELLLCHLLDLVSGKSEVEGGPIKVLY